MKGELGTRFRYVRICMYLGCRNRSMFCSIPSSSSSQWSYSDEGHSSKTLVQTSSDDRKSLNRGSRERKRHTEHTNKSAKRRRYDRDNHSSRESDSHLSKSSSSHSEDASHHDLARERLWVAPNLRVRIVDRKFKKGKYYNTKVRYLLSTSSSLVFLCSESSNNAYFSCVYVYLGRNPWCSEWWPVCLSDSWRKTPGRYSRFTTSCMSRRYMYMHAMSTGTLGWSNFPSVYINLFMCSAITSYQSLLLSLPIRQHNVICRALILAKIEFLCLT